MTGRLQRLAREPSSAALREHASGVLRQIPDGRPNLDDFHLEGRCAEALGKEGQHVIDACCRRRLDCLYASFVCGFADLLGESMVGPDYFAGLDADRRQHRRVREVDHPLEAHRD